MTILRTAVWVLGLAVVVFGQAESPSKSQLRILYVGEEDHADRTREFASFLGERFAAVRTVTHATVDAAAVDASDVVLLEWHQGREGTFPPKSCPLGARGEWRRPTVLLGSAGLFIACIWEVNGGSG